MNLSKKIAAVLAVAAMLFSLASCAMSNRPDPSESGDVPQLKLAEKVNTVETGDVAPKEPEPAPAVEEKTVTVALAGDIKLSEAMISDAHAQAAEGKEYSFLRMYTGAYRTLNGADLAVGMYSALGQPYGTEAEYEPPTEHIDALSALGLDVLDISGMGSDYALLNERGIKGISSSENTDAVRTVEVGQMKLSFVACGYEDTLAQCYSSDDFLKLIEDSDGECDSLVVFVHWDKDIGTDQKREAVMPLIEAGADVVVGDGETVEAVEHVPSDSKEAVVCYSLGNLLSDANEAVNLVSGILTLTYPEDGAALPDEVAVVPTFVHYSVHEDGTRGDYSVYRVEDYTAELAHSHSCEVDPDGLTGYVRSVFDYELLPDALK